VKRKIYDEVQRPQIHYSPRVNWMNDPNGCIYYKGVYHLYYQYHPFSSVWGPMHWGHAVSTDLISWEEKPIALYPDETCGWAFSGSAVFDKTNSSGLFDEEGGIAVLYTGHKTGEENRLQHQQQCLAFSPDEGETLIPYEKNPVIPSLGRSDFRDPKVFYHGETGAWIMVVSAAWKLEIYRSRDLKEWFLSSSLALEGTAPHRLYECPDLIQVPVEGKQGESVWMMSVSLLKDDQTSAGGTLYAFGAFDGHQFIQGASARIMDHGYDFYAQQSWSNVSDGRAVIIGWINHWGYAHVTPTAPWRGCMSLPRELTAVKTPDGGWRLRQRPVKELEAYRLKPLVLDAGQAGRPLTLARGEAHEILFRNLSSQADRMKLRLSNRCDEQIIIAIDCREGVFTVDRRSSSCLLFDEEFPPVVEAAVPTVEGALDIRVVLDRSVLEIFASEGEVVMTNLFFLSEEIDSLTIEGFSDETGTVVVTPVRSIWKH